MKINSKLKNLQLVCEWENKDKKNIVTNLRTKSVRSLKQDEILVKNIFVPLHGSFWLASSYSKKHPRIQEFMENNQFVFGNGGVSRVIKKHKSVSDVQVGDFVAILGHYPCSNDDCYSCKVLHRYTECQYNEGKIIGHGKGSLDGTLARYTILPKYSYEVCFKKKSKPTSKEIEPFMFSFLLADVRNAITRMPDLLKGNRMAIFGAGLSGTLASYFFSKTTAGSKIFIIDKDYKKIKYLKKKLLCKTSYHVLNKKLCEELEKKVPQYNLGQLLNSEIKLISKKMNKFFHNKNLNLLMDCSSSNSSQLWSNDEILRESATIIPFGFGSDGIYLSSQIIQKSGLTILMSRGVGNQRNRKETIELIKNDKGKFIKSLLLKNTKKIKGLNNFHKYLKKENKNTNHTPVIIEM
jgi:threonine dehydrogenase-like Zn-dependent dehydrogenase